MRISVVIPCHNAGPWIATALHSVAEQSRPPAEIIVVDDASTDDSLAQIAASGVGAKVLSVHEHNAAAARNYAIHAATGDWIALLDADDRWYPNHLERAMQIMQRCRADIAYRGSCDEMDVEGQVQPVNRPQPLTTVQVGLTHQDYAALEMREMQFAHSTFVIQRARLLSIGGYDPAQVRRHDIDLWLRLIVNQTWSFDPLPTAAYRRDTPGSIGRNVAECELYYLRAWLKNRAAYEGDALKELLRKTARRAMSLALVNGDAATYQEARKLAMPHLPRFHRTAYAVGDWFPGLLQSLIRLKRAWFTYRTGYRLEPAAK